MTPDAATSASRRLYPRPEPPPSSAPSAALSTDRPEPTDADPRPDADVVWAYFDTDTGEAVLTLTDDARGVLRLRTDDDEHEAVLLAVLTAARLSARTTVDVDARTWWAAVARQGEAILDQVRGIRRLPQISREDP
ncbi:hypothetical protein O4J56_31825 [Nocardiopsis sp. RSe5-2]|uniref:Uncharacterized protein n=1 Tax=Nocardiopsis endophytica TaxID=3018445 RepID=A0ABT4UE64_9ACTN|nr:hypothetical protein [Nocardiopsis endophytica]MDA2815274.1 hypothetical protein [Nocardiopsis endophytica]